MRFVMISLLIDCLLLFGISYLAFGDTEIVTTYETHTHQSVRCIDDMSCKSEFGTSQKFCIIPPEIRCVVCPSIPERKTTRFRRVKFNNKVEL